MPSCAGFLEPKKSSLHCRNLRQMLTISYTACPFLSQLISAQLVLEMCLAARNRQKSIINSYFGVQDHPRSLNSKTIESQCTTSY